MYVYYGRLEKNMLKSMLLGFFLLILPLIDVNRSGKTNWLLLTVFGGLGVVVIVRALLEPARLKKNIAEMGIGERELAQDLAAGKSFSHCEVGQEYILDYQSPKVMRLKDLAQAYMKIEGNSTTNLRHCVILTDRDGKITSLRADQELEMKLLHEEIMKRVPYIMDEYDRGYIALRNTPEILAKVLDERKAKMEKEMPAIEKSRQDIVQTQIQIPIRAEEKKTVTKKLVLAKIGFWISLVFVIGSFGIYVILTPMMNNKNFDGAERIKGYVRGETQDRLEIQYQGKWYVLHGTYYSDVRDGEEKDAYLYKGEMYTTIYRVQETTFWGFLYNNVLLIMGVFFLLVGAFCGGFMYESRL